MAARQPGGRERINSVAWLKDPQVVGKSSEFMPTLTEGVARSLQGYDMSWII